MQAQEKRIRSYSRNFTIWVSEQYKIDDEICFRHPKLFKRVRGVTMYPSNNIKALTDQCVSFASEATNKFKRSDIK